MAIAAKESTAPSVGKVGSSTNQSSAAAQAAAQAAATLAAETAKRNALAAQTAATDAKNNAAAAAAAAGNANPLVDSNVTFVIDPQTDIYRVNGMGMCNLSQYVSYMTKNPDQIANAIQRRNTGLQKAKYDGTAGAGSNLTYAGADWDYTQLSQLK